VDVFLLFGFPGCICYDIYAVYEIFDIDLASWSFCSLEILRLFFLTAFLVDSLIAAASRTCLEEAKESFVCLIQIACIGTFGICELAVGVAVGAADAMGLGGFHLAIVDNIVDLAADGSQFSVIGRDPPSVCSRGVLEKNLVRVSHL